MKVIVLVLSLSWIGICALKIQIDDQHMNCKQVFELPSRDSVFLNPVYFCMDSLKNNFYYTSLKTTVCNDSLCQLVFLDIYWDLGGNYIRFDTLRGKPMTKNDHMPFTTQDYCKLQMTLSDENSILGEKSKDELLDKNQTRYSEKIDAFTGATAREIRSAVVEGALYSTYTLWHLVNGDIKQKMREYSLLNYDAEIEHQLLNSQNPKTMILGLKNLDDAFYFDHFEEILRLMQSGHPLVNFYIAKKMPPAVLDTEKNRNAILKLWDTFDRNTQSVLSRYMNP